MALGLNGFSLTIEKGSTRVVWVFKTFVIKFPRFIAWRLFLHGLLANMQERLFNTLNDQRFAKVYLSDPIGLFVVMEYCRPLTDDEWRSLINLYNEWKSSYNGYGSEAEVPVEKKRSSFGVTKHNKLVAIDYGS